VKTTLDSESYAKWNNSPGNVCEGVTMTKKLLHRQIARSSTRSRLSLPSNLFTLTLKFLRIDGGWRIMWFKEKRTQERSCNAYPQWLRNDSICNSRVSRAQAYLVQFVFPFTICHFGIELPHFKTRTPLTFDAYERVAILRSGIQKGRLLSFNGHIKSRDVSTDGLFVRLSIYRNLENKEVSIATSTTFSSW